MAPRDDDFWPGQTKLACVQLALRITLRPHLTPHARLIFGQETSQRNSKTTLTKLILALRTSGDAIFMSSKKFVLDTALGNVLGVPSGRTPSVARAAKFVAYDAPKYFLYDALWGGLAEGLGLREPRPLIAPWEEPEQPKPDVPPVRLRGYNVSELR